MRHAGLCTTGRRTKPTSEKLLRCRMYRCLPITARHCTTVLTDTTSRSHLVQPDSTALHGAKNVRWKRARCHLTLRFQYMYGQRHICWRKRSFKLAASASCAGPVVSNETACVFSNNIQRNSQLTSECRCALPCAFPTLHVAASRPLCAVAITASRRASCTAAAVALPHPAAAQHSPRRPRDAVAPARAQ